MRKGSTEETVHRIDLNDPRVSGIYVPVSSALFGQGLLSETHPHTRAALDL